MRNYFVLLILFALFSKIATGQDEVLFKVGDTPVSVSEFVYIYDKTIGEDAGYTKASLEEYLSLYENFKLKVLRAKEMKLDTVMSLQNELAGYRKQLADSYLIDKAVTERLIREVYERKKQDVDIAHILVKLPKNASEKQNATALAKINKAKEKIDSGVSFAEVAVAFSEDKSVQENYGRIGYVTALFPKGFYNLETAAYDQAIGVVSEPIRTLAGYHLLKVFDRRKAKGEVEIAHILRRINKTKVPVRHPKVVIDSIYEELGKGRDFGVLAAAESEDRNSAKKGGYIGVFGINTYEKAFEEAAFGLLNDGDFSEPFKTSSGFHIVKRISRKELADYSIERNRIQAMIKKDDRFEEAKKAMISNIQKDGNLRIEKENFNSFKMSLDSSFTTTKWDSKTYANDQKALIRLGNNFTVSVNAFANYLSRTARKRLTLSRAKGIEEATDVLFEDFLEERTIAYEEERLEDRYPEFRNLMREYEEGIMLFEATKIEVWDKASQDTVGLNAFYEENKEKYQWKDRVKVTKYRIAKENSGLAEKIRNYAKSHSPEEVEKKYNNSELTQVFVDEQKIYEKGRNKEIDALKWKTGETTFVKINLEDQSRTFIKVEEVYQPRLKTLDEGRGYVVADYQDLLEKRWIETLRKKYPIKVNQKVFKSLIKK